MAGDTDHNGTRRDSALVPPRQFVALALIQVLIAAELVVFTIAPPVAASPVSEDRWLVPFVLLLAVFTYFVSPRLTPWTCELAVILTWLTIAGMTATRATGQGQIILGMTMFLLMVFVVYFLPRRRASIQIIAMVVAYAGALVFNARILGAEYAVLIIVIIASGALIVTSLREVDRQYRLLVDHASEVIFHSSHGVVQWISPPVAQVLGWTQDELVGTSIHRLWHPDDHEAAIALRDAAYAGTSGMGVFRFLTRDGRYVWIEITFKPYRDPHPGAVGTMRDVSARVAAEEALIASENQYRLLAEIEAERHRQVAALEESNTRLFQDISHELRTPLSVIQAQLHGLAHDSGAAGLSARQRADVESAARAALSLQRLVDGILDVARGQAGALVVDPEPIDVAALVCETAAMFRSAAEQQGVQLTVATVGFPPVVMADRDAWSKILLNLLSNAVKFTPGGQIGVDLHHDGEFAELRVTDTGVGIAEDELSSVFGRFRQADNRSAAAGSGSGIGLALVAELLRACGGGIQVRSTVGVGTTFTVRVPAEPTDLPPTVSDARERPWSRADARPWIDAMADEDAYVPGDDVGQQRGRILLVEDHADLRSYIARLLRGAGWQVTAVPDAEIAATALPGHDLLVSDIMLPGMDGVELVRRVRSDDRYRWMPVVLLTARAGRDSVLEGLAAGADDFVTKPFDPDELVARVSTHVELALLRRLVLEQAEDKAAQLQRSLASNRTIGTALGILMALHKISAEESFGRMREVSQRTNRKLRDVADEVVLTGTLPSTELAPPLV